MVKSAPIGGAFFFYPRFIRSFVLKKGYGTKTDSEYCLFGKPDKAMG